METTKFNFKVFWMDFCHYTSVEQGKLLAPNYEPSLYLQNPSEPQPIPSHLQGHISGEESLLWFEYWHKYWWNEVLMDIANQKDNTPGTHTPLSAIPHDIKKRTSITSPLTNKRPFTESQQVSLPTPRVSKSSKVSSPIVDSTPVSLHAAKRRKESSSVSELPTAETENHKTKEPFKAAKLMQEWLVGQLTGTNLDGVYNEASQRFRCNAPGCTLDFINKTMWRQHAIRHLHVPMTCSACGKRYDEMATLLNHTKKCQRV